MSWRTLIEIDHDVICNSNPTSLGEAIHTLARGAGAPAEDLSHIGVIVLRTRHHSDGYTIIGDDGFTRREISWTPDSGALIVRSKVTIAVLTK